MAKNAKEPFIHDHATLPDDSALLAPPRARGLAPLTPLTLFVCTYVAKLGGLRVSFIDLTRAMCVNPHGCLLAVNSNYGHACQPGHEALLKTPKPPAPRQVPTRGRARKVQGDGLCFNSAVEPIISIALEGIAPDKVYKVKCFPSTGETQVPGVILPDLSDGHAVLEAFVAYLNELGVNVPVPGALPVLGAPGALPALEQLAPIHPPVVILREQPKMLNYKFRVVRSCPRLLVNLRALTSFMRQLETAKAIENVPLTPRQAALLAAWPGAPLPPFLVRETKPPTDDVKVTFRFRGANRAPRINIFQEGKINILGADSAESAEQIYAFFERLFSSHWADFTCLQPRRDVDRRNRAAAAAEKLTAAAERLADVASGVARVAGAAAKKLTDMAAAGVAAAAADASSLEGDVAALPPTDQGVRVGGELADLDADTATDWLAELEAAAAHAEAAAAHADATARLSPSLLADLDCWGDSDDGDNDGDDD